jgi:acetyl esterase
VAPAFVITAEFDPLRDEGEAYGERLKKEGVPVEIKRYDGAIHGFFSFGHIMDQGKQAVADAAARLRRAFTK